MAKVAKSGMVLYALSIVSELPLDGCKRLQKRLSMPWWVNGRFSISAHSFPQIIRSIIAIHLLCHVKNVNRAVDSLVTMFCRILENVVRMTKKTKKTTLNLSR